MKPIYITLTNSRNFILYNKELNNFFNELESKLTVSGVDLIYIPDTEVISLLEKVLPSLGILTISRRETIALRRRPDGLVVERVKFFSYYTDNWKKYTIKLL